MRRLNSHLKSGALAAVVAIGALAATATTANAYIACNRAGECWRVANRVVYPANLRVVIYPDTWRKAHPRARWLADRPDKDDRGYYDRGVWRKF